MNLLSNYLPIVNIRRIFINIQKSNLSNDLKNILKN
jgi:hypothetical protein